MVHVVTADGHGWHVRISIGEETITRHCASWQSVERTVSWLRRHAHQSAGHITAPVAAVLAMLMLVFNAAAVPAQPAATPDAVQAFTSATRDYALMHRRLEQQLGPMEVTANPAVILRHIENMAAAIRASRPDAKQGDLFTPALAPVLRTRIATALAEHDFTADDVRAAALGEGAEFASVPLRVNGTFPWILGNAMFPTILAALPPLPPELQYRIVGDDLLLIDVHASLIVDILPSALAGTHDTNPRPDGLMQ